MTARLPLLARGRTLQIVGRQRKRRKVLWGKCPFLKNPPNPLDKSGRAWYNIQADLNSGPANVPNRKNFLKKFEKGVDKRSWM